MNLLKILKIMRKYQILKAKELKLKEKMRLNMNSSIINIGKLQHMLPKGKMPHILKEDEEAKRKIQTYKPKDKKAELEKKRYDDLELELQQIQEKLIKFATRVPVFMYLTDYRERCLKDVITQLEPGLFKKVTGLTVKDFELLVSLGVFNSALMNDAVYKFKRYEDSSLEYTGVNKHEGEDVGLYDTILNSDEYRATFENVAEKV